MSDQTEGAVAPGENLNLLAPVADADQKPSEEKAESPPAAKDPGETKEPKGFMKRIDELTRNWRSTERDRDYWREMALRSQQPQVTQTEAPRTLQDFGGDEAKFTTYLESRADKIIESRLAEAETKRARAERSKVFKKAETKFAKTVDDYAEVAHYAPISAEVADLVMELENGPEVAYYLGNNHEEAESLSAMSEKQAALALGRLEVKLSAEREKTKAKKVSEAPPPTPKIEGSDPGDIDTEPNSSWSDAKWRKWREKQISQRR